MIKLPAMKKPTSLAVLISGGGTTLVNLHEKISAGLLDAQIVQVIADRECKGIERARKLGYPVTTIARSEFESRDQFSSANFQACQDAGTELVILGGYLNRILIPTDFELRVLNIHPSLIPAFCGRGMYGHHVHEAAIKRGVQWSGCTVHFCDNEYDNGPIILQQMVPVLPTDSPDLLAERVFAAECEAYPEAIRRVISGDLTIDGNRIIP